MKPETIGDMGRLLMQYGQPVDTGHWQSLKDVPQVKTFELGNAIYQLGIPTIPDLLAKIVAPNLPWAELQFQERVAGVPVNPGETYKQWPWYRGNVEEHKPQGAFSHTYMERFWPRVAGQGGPTHYNNQGIRYRYGDLNDVLALLAREPHTRQAYLPIFFPEDTGAHHGGRIPCTLGYHFLLRGGKLHINYFIRSCDFLRHFRDDVYMAGRLCQWVLEQLVPQFDTNDSSDSELEKMESPWHDAVPGTLTMFMSSLHVFEGDLPKMRKMYG